MYLEHFDLQRLPFALDSDPDFLVPLLGQEDAARVIRAGLEGGDGFIKVVGPVGSGKTLLCRELLEQLRGEHATAYIPNPELSARELLIELAAELGISSPPTGSTPRLREVILARALDVWSDGRSTVILIDEAQAMPAPTLESLRLLSNVEPRTGKLLQVVLFGQPELDARLARPGLRQLRQRFGTRVRLDPLSAPEARAYLESRLRTAGAHDPGVFSFRAAARLARASGGIPRLINVLAHKSLLAAFAEGSPRVESRHVGRAARDTDDVLEARGPLWRRVVGPAIRRDA